jgi:hypothetical protein
MFLGTTEVVPDSTTIWNLENALPKVAKTKKCGTSYKRNRCLEPQDKEGNNAGCAFHNNRSWVMLKKILLAEMRLKLGGAKMEPG